MRTPHARSMTELLSVAAALEAEAAVRYAALARLVRAQGNEGLARLFERLAREEGAHEQAILEWADASGLRLERATHAPRWEEAGEAADPGGQRTGATASLTSYEALAQAVRNEERAFRYFCHVAAHAPDASVRDAAEVLAREELGHAALLRVERRRAYAAEGGGAGRPPAPAVRDGAGLAQAALGLERAVRDHLLASRGAAAAAARTATERLIAALVVEAGAGAPADAPRAPSPARPFDCLEAAFAFYDAVAAAPASEAVQARALALAQDAVQRLVALARADAEAGAAPAG